MTSTRRARRYVICLDNKGYAASLETRKVYPVIADAAASREGLLRVVDESGEDYLYPAERFAPVDLSAEAKRALARAG